MKVKGRAVSHDYTGEKPTVKYKPYYSMRNVQEWLVDKDLWTWEDADWYWREYLDCPSNGSFEPICPEDAMGYVEEGEPWPEDEPEYERSYRLTKILFDALGEEDWYVEFLFDW